TTHCSRYCQLHFVAGKLVANLTSALAPGNAVHPRGPLDGHVGDRLLGGRIQGVEALGTATLHLFDEDAAVGQTDHAELADQVRGHRVAHLVEKNIPAVEIRAQTVAANLDRGHLLSGPGRPEYFVEIGLRHTVVKMRGRARPDIADHRHLGRRRLFSDRERLASGQQPLRRHPEPPGVFFGVLRAVVAAPRALRALMGAIGRYRDSDCLAGEARRLEALLARHSYPLSSAPS